MTDFLPLAFTFLAAGVIAVPIASRLGLGSVLGYLLAGIAISPLLTGVMDVDIKSIQQFAEFGVVMMLFLVGLELEPSKLWQMRGRLIGLGGGQVVITALAIMGIAMWMEYSWQTSLAVGLILALSSTAIVLQTLNEKGLMKSDGGQATFSVLLFQDIAVIPMLALMPLLVVSSFDGTAVATAGGGGGLSLVEDLPAWQAALISLGAIAFVIFGGNYLSRPLFRFIASARLRELFTAAALLLVIGIALLMQLVGLSAALGTFLAGVVLATSEYRHELEADIDPFKGLLLGLFFITVGANIKFDLLAANAATVMTWTAGLIALKVLILYGLSRAFKVGGSDRWLFSLGLAQAGEFGFVLLAPSVTGDILPAALTDQLLLVVTLSMLLTPVLFIVYDKLIAPRFSRAQARKPDVIEETGEILLAGHGRVGGIVNRIVQSAGYTTTVIDFSSRHLDIMRKFGFHAYFGDATRPDLLHSAGIAEAKILIVAIDDKHQVTELVRHAIAHYPNLHVIARAIDRDHTYELWSVGCRDIIRETYDSSLRMGRSALEALGSSRDKAQLMVDTFHEDDQHNMVEVADVYDVNIPARENEAYVKKVRDMIEERTPALQARIQAIMSGD